jgi:UDP-4-amino-4-deoxy-L-arabinose-oxoglutarate aminotransferase
MTHSPPIAVPAERALSEPLPFLPFTRPTLSDDDIQSVVDVLRSGWITTGAKVEALEAAFTELTGAPYAIAVTSATAGLQIVLHALGMGPGQEVITPSLTWVSTVNLIRLCGATPVFVDVDRDTLMASAVDIAPAITDKTRLIIPVHFAGAPVDMDGVQRLADDHGIPVVEDAAHALGTTCHGRPVGHRGTSIFSLQAIKNVTTAEGGVICTDDEDLADRLRKLRFHGLAASAFDRESKGRLPAAEVVEPGFKCNLPDMNACLGLGQMERLESINGKRRQLAERYLAAFADNPYVMPLGLPDYPHGHAWHLFVVRADIDRLTVNRAEIMALLKARGIGTGLHFLPVHRHSYYREAMPNAGNGLVHTDWNGDRIMTLPLFPAMTDADVDRVVAALDEVTRTHLK